MNTEILLNFDGTNFGWTPVDTTPLDSPTRNPEDLGQAPFIEENKQIDADASESEPQSADISTMHADFEQKRINRDFNLLHRDGDILDIEFTAPARVQEVRDNIINNSVMVTKPTIYDFLATIKQVIHEIPVADLKEDEKDNFNKFIKMVHEYCEAIADEKIQDSVGLAQKYSSTFAVVNSKFAESSNHKIKILSDELAALQRQLDEVLAKQATNNALQKETATKLAISVSEKESFERRYHELRSSAGDFELREIRWTTEKENIERSLTEVKAENVALQKDVGQKNDQIRELAQNLSSAKDGEHIMKLYQDALRENSRLDERYKNMEKDYKSVIKENEKQMKDVNEKLGRIPVMQSEFQQKNKEFAREIEKLKSEDKLVKDSSNKEIERLNAELKKANDTIVKLQALQQTNTKLQKDLDIAIEERKKVEDQANKLYADLEERAKSIGSVENKMNTVQAQNDQLVMQKDEFNRVKKESDTNLRNLDDLKKKYSKESSLVLERETEIRKLKQQSDKMQEKVDRANEKEKELQVLLENVQKVQKIGGDGKAIDDREEKLERHKEEIRKLTRKYQEERQKIEVAWQELEKQKIENEETKRNNEEKSEHLEQVLRSNKPHVVLGSRGKRKPWGLTEAVGLTILTALIVSAFWNIRYNNRFYY